VDDGFARKPGDYASQPIIDVLEEHSNQRQMKLISDTKKESIRRAIRQKLTTVVNFNKLTVSAPRSPGWEAKLRDYQAMDPNHVMNHVEGIRADTFLMKAIKSKQYDSVKYLLDLGLSPAKTNINGWNATHFAAESDSIEIMAFLLEELPDTEAISLNPQKLDPNFGENFHKGWAREALVALDHQSVKGYIPLHLSVRNGNLSTVNYLIRVYKNREIMRKRGKVECKPFKEVIEARNNDNFTPFLYATKNSATTIAKTLIENGANIYAKDRKGWNGLHWAVHLKNVEMVKLLIASDADRNSLRNDTDNRGLTPSLIGNEPTITRLFTHIWDPHALSDR